MLRPPTAEMCSRMKSIQRFGHQRQPFVAVDEQLAHRQRASRSAGGACWNQAASSGAKRILEEEQPVRLQGLRELDGLGRGHALVDVVEQLDVEAELRAQVVEHLDRVVDVGRRARRPARGDPRGPRLSHVLRGLAGRAVGRDSRGRRAARGRGGSPWPATCAPGPRAPAARRAGVGIERDRLAAPCPRGACRRAGRPACRGCPRGRRRSRSGRCSG